MAAYCVRIAEKLCADNPQLRWVMGSKHLKLMIGSRLVGILSKSTRRKDINDNMKVQLRRCGLKVDI